MRFATEQFFLEQCLVFTDPFKTSRLSNRPVFCFTSFIVTNSSVVANRSSDKKYLIARVFWCPVPSATCAIAGPTPS